MTEAQKCLYHIAENMRMDKSISKEGYKYFQQAIKALEQEAVLDKIRAEIKYLHDWAFSREEILKIIDKYKIESEDNE